MSGAAASRACRQLRLSRAIVGALCCGQVRQETLHLRLAHLGRVPQPVEADVGPRPVHVGFFGAQAVVQQPDALSKLVQQPD